jgi:hypothetical protein
MLRRLLRPAALVLGCGGGHLHALHSLIGGWDGDGGLGCGLINCRLTCVFQVLAVSYAISIAVRTCYDTCNVIWVWAAFGFRLTR